MHTYIYKQVYMYEALTCAASLVHTYIYIRVYANIYIYRYVDMYMCMYMCTSVSSAWLIQVIDVCQMHTASHACALAIMCHALLSDT